VLHYAGLNSMFLNNLIPGKHLHLAMKNTRKRSVG
jgi:hypothetical protein